MKLLKLLAEVKEVEQNILEKFYQEEEDITDEETKLQLLKNELAIKLKQYVYVIKNKFFENTKDIIDKKIKDLQNEKKYLDIAKQRIELAIHNYVIEGEGAIEVLNDEGKVEYYVSKDYSIKRSIEGNVEKEYQKYILPELTYDQYQMVISTLYNSQNNFDFIINNVKTRCLVTDLPEAHSSIKKTIRPTIKITKSKPKDTQ